MCLWAALGVGFWPQTHLHCSCDTRAVLLCALHDDVDAIAWFPNPPNSDRHLIGSRSLVRQLARLRTGHCRTASFLHSRNLLDSPLCTACSPPAPPVLQTVEHLLCNCPVYRQERRLLRNSVRDSLQLDPRLAVTVDHLLSPCAQVATQLQVANALVAYIAVAFAGFL